MRIGIDARFLTHPQAGGFRTYTRSLIAALANRDQVNEYLLYGGNVQGDISPPSPNFRFISVPEDMPLLGMVWREQKALPRQIKRDRLDIFHALCLTAPLRLPCPSVVTIHDMIWRRPVQLNPAKPSVKHLLLDAYYRYVPERAAARAAAVITVSEAARQRILDELHLSPERVSVTLEGASPHFCLVDKEAAYEAVRARFGLTHGYILAMGSADPRKNVSGLMHAYAALPAALRDQHPLVVVWTHRHLADSLSNLADALVISTHLHFLQDVSDSDLVNLYAAASLFAFPSRYEGFGLPLLEAMACGTPVISANNSSLPEIAGKAALLLDAEDTEAWTNGLMCLLTDETLRGGMIRMGLARAAEFSWDRCAQDTIAVYEKVLHNGY